MPSKTKPRLSSSSGFTLVEILIVICVIALMAAIILPVFNRAKNSARTANCASNLRQIGIAFRLYTDDSRGFHPVINSQKANCGWAEQIYPYTHSTKVFQCPSFDYGEFKLGCLVTEPTNDSQFPFTNWGGSYDLNYFTSPSPFNQMRIRVPSETIVFCDGTGGRGSFSQLVSGHLSNGVPVDARDLSPLGNRHNFGANVAYADGHVKWKSYESLLDIKQWQPR